MVVVNGLSAADVVEITHTEISRVKEELTLVAQDTAEARINSLIEAVTDHFADRPELFKAFGEPDFQYSLKDAARAAASNDEEHTEQLLVDLLANRASEGNGARVRLATSQALLAADKLSKEALNGITALWAITYLRWEGEELSARLSQAEEVAQSLLVLGLPAEPSWIEDADALNLLRVQHAGSRTRRTYTEVLRAKVREHLQPGIHPAWDQDLLDTVEKQVPGFTELLRPHPLKVNHLMLPHKSIDEVRETLPAGTSPSWQWMMLVRKAGVGTESRRAVEALDRILKERAAFSQIESWWNSVPMTDFTVVGDVIGFVNGRRYLEIEGVQTVGELLQHRSS